MASITCKNGPEHHHSSVYESKVCWGIIKVAPPVRTFTRPHEVHAPYDPVTRKQLDYIADLGGDVRAAKHLSKQAASKLIDELKQGKKSVPTTTSRARVEDPRESILSAMIESVPTGYYAVREQEGAPMTFVRVSRPKTGHYKDAIKVQTIHGDNLKDRAVRWNGSGKWTFLQYDTSILDSIVLLVAGYQDAALLYALEIGKCCRCNARLTDDRSRHYGIGPECEQYWPWVIELVDERNAG